MANFKVFLVFVLFLLSADFIATFFYHVPEHIFGKYHALIHHSPNRSFIYYALVQKKPRVLLSGFMAFLPYCIFIPVFWAISPIGTLLGVAIAGVHVCWRHQPIRAQKTPVFLQKICEVLYITTPERHWKHHQNYRVAYGDIFTFYDQPAQKWYKILVQVKKKCRSYFNLI
ncbi:conserved hypothetical protein [Planktothrix serta PCC 8927]|uniref:Fatty acid hydroxylase domain-containing protein n=1 Tax=Planktothrix serta PCC 8927 TaxID=671068 RepID=A0A7Z9BNE6_9CYAN|nr:sterol desaturase family protein [Planktothrix serta]VXD15065.1 conserved hypothetical protein [Planktothrix serta PCC 8927]